MNLTASIFVALAAAGAGEPSATYLQAVERYRRGEQDAAIQEVVSGERLHDEVAGLKRLLRAAGCRTCEARRSFESFPFEAAAMLHTDRDRFERETGLGAWARVDASVHRIVEREQRIAGKAPQLEAAQTILSLIPDPERRRRFERPWRLAAALQLHRFMEWDLALALLDAGLRDQPGDARLLLARGSLLETMSTLESLGMTRHDELTAAAGSRRDAVWSQMADTRSRLAEAETCYRRALAADPGLHEARVRRAHALQRLGRPDKALPELEAVLASTEANAGARYLAYLFLGASHEAAGRLREAIEAFEAAARVEPEGQAACIALSHARHRTGDRAGSRAALERALASAGQRRRGDPWWIYLWGQAPESERLLEDLRREATR